MKRESSLLVMHQPNALEMTEQPKVLKSVWLVPMVTCIITMPQQ